MYLEAATQLLNKGFSIIPLRHEDKKPAFNLLPTKKSVTGKERATWEPYLTRHATMDEVTTWFTDDQAKVGLVCGKISGEIGVIDFDEPKLIVPWIGKVGTDDHFAALVEKLVCVTTPSGGYHLIYRCPEGAGGSQKLAMDGDETLIELKAEGGYVCVAPAPGYMFSTGDFDSIPTINLVERDILLNAARAFDKRPKAVAVQRKQVGTNFDLPGDDYCAKTCWDDVLLPAGWSPDVDDDRRWRRPGKTDSTHADIIDGGNTLRVFSDSDSKLKQGQYSRFQAYTFINHDGNFSAAAKTLRQNGFGKQGAQSKEVADIDWSDPNSFGEPLLFDVLNTPELDSSCLPSWCAQYAEAVALSTQTPIALSVMLGLAALGVALQFKFEIAPKGIEDDYREPANIWTFTGLTSGNRKSEVFRLMKAPLEEWETYQNRLLKDDLAANKNDRRIIEKRIEYLQTKAAQADKDDVRQGYQLEIRELERTKPAIMRGHNLFTGDATPEAFRNYLDENGCKGAILADEGGIFTTIAGLYSQGRSNIDVFLNSHANGPLRVLRGKEIYTHPHCVATFGLSAQPTIISDLCGGSAKTFRDKGLLARFLYALPKSMVGERDVYASNPVPSALTKAYHSHLDTLLSSKPDKDIFGEDKPWTLTFSPAARDAWMAFAAWIEPRQKPGGEFESLKDFTGKLPGTCARIAMLKHLGEYGPGNLEIQASTVLPVIEFCKKLIPHTQTVFNMMSVDATVGDAKFCIEWLQSSVEKSETNAYFFGQNHLHKSSRFKNSKSDRVKKALDVLLERNLISAPQKVMTRGRSSIIYYVHPTVITGTDMKRIERADSSIVFVDDNNKKKVLPTVEWCRERLIKLLEEAGGDAVSQVVQDFWNDRAKDMVGEDELTSTWGEEVYARLWDIWVELTMPPQEVQIEPVDEMDLDMTPAQEVVAPVVVDVFADFGM